MGLGGAGSKRGACASGRQQSDRLAARRCVTGAMQPTHLVGKDDQDGGHRGVAKQHGGAPVAEGAQRQRRQRDEQRRHLEGPAAGRGGQGEWAGPQVVSGSSMQLGVHGRLHFPPPAHQAVQARRYASNLLKMAPGLL